MMMAVFGGVAAGLLGSVLVAGSLKLQIIS